MQSAENYGRMTWTSQIASPSWRNILSAALRRIDDLVACLRNVFVSWGGFLKLLDTFGCLRWECLLSRVSHRLYHRQSLEIHWNLPTEKLVLRRVVVKFQLDLGWWIWYFHCVRPKKSLLWMKACNCWADRYLKNWIQRKDGLQVPSVPDKLWIIFDCEVAGDMHVSGSSFTWYVVPMPCWVTTRTGMKICLKAMWRNCPRGFLVAFQKSCWRSSVEVYKENSLFHMFTWQYLKRKFLQEMLLYICIIWQRQQHLRL